MAFPAPLTPVAPLGSLVYDQTTSGIINPAGDTDAFTLNVDPGQTITVLVTPTTAGLQPTVQLLDATNSVIGTATAAAAGQNALIQATPTVGTTTGTYKIVVGGGATIGDYTVQVILNAGQELEGTTAGTNNTTATAQNIDGSFVAPAGAVPSALRGALLGRTDVMDYTASAVPYAFEDIHTTGTTINFSNVDDAATQIPVGFTFSFYGNNYSNLYVSTNGLITFGYGDSDYWNTDLTNSPFQAAIAPFWEDLYVAGAADSKVVYQVLGSGASTHLVIQWNDISFYWDYPTTGGLTFEAVLGIDGSVRFNYKSLVTGHNYGFDDHGAFATAGIKNVGVQGPSRNLLMYQNGPTSLIDSLKSLRLAPPSILPDDYAFTVAAAETDSLAVTNLSPEQTVRVELLDSSGTAIATGVGGSTTVSQIISNFHLATAGTYYARVTGGSDVPYSLVVTRNAAFDTEPNDTSAAAQSLDGTQGALGAVTPTVSHTTLTFDELPLQPANGLSFRGVTFGYTVGGFASSEAYYGDYGPGVTAYTQDPGLEGYTDGVLTLNLAQPVAALQFGLAVSSTVAVPDAATVSLYTATSILIGTFTVPTDPNGFLFASGQFVYNGATPVSRAVISFNSNAAGAFLIDNLSFTTLLSPYVDDWYSITVNNPSSHVSLATSTPGDGAGEFVNNLMPKIELYNPSGTLVASGVTAVDGRNQTLQYTAPAAGVYRVHVLANSGTTGEYFLNSSVQVGPPAVTINQASTQADPTNASPVNFTVVFNEPVSDFDTGDVTLSGTAPGTLVGTVTGSGTTYNVAVSGMTGSGTIVAQINAGVAHNAAGDSNLASTSTDNSVNYDVTPPTVTIDQAATQPDPTNVSPINFTVVFSEPVGDFVAGDVTLSGTAPGTLVVAVTGSGTTYNVAVSGMSGPGTVTATIAAGTAHDAAGNPNDASTSTDNTVTDTLTPPTVTIDQATGQADPTNASPINFTVVFSEAVSGFTTGDVTFSGTAPGTLVGTVTGSGATYNVAVTGMTGSGTVVATIAAGVAQDADGDPNLGSTSTDHTVTYDVTPPTVTINQASGQADPTGASPINFTVVFSEPVSDFAAGDVTFSGTAPGTLMGTVTGSGTTYNVAVNGMTGSGTVVATIAAGIAHDSAGNANLGSTSTDHTVTYDVTPPTVTINQASGQADPTGASPINFTVVFSEPVSDFAAGDVTFSGTAPGTLMGTVTGSGATYNVAVSGMTGSGTVIATIAAGIAHDAAGNANLASTSTDHTVTYDIIAPTVTIDQATVQADPTNGSPINFTVIFSETVSDFTTGDVTFTGTAPGMLVGTVTGSGATYNVAVSGMTGSGTVVATIIAGKAHDAAGNPNTASSSTDNSVVYDVTPPSVTINQASGQADPTVASPINFTVIFSEPVSDFTAGDVTFSGTAPGMLAGTVTGSGATYNVAVSGMTNAGTVVATITAGKAHDLAGNANVASTSLDNTVMYANSAPTALVSTPPSPQSGSVTINYRLSDPGSDVSSILVECSADGGVTWKTATAGAGGDGTTGLATSPAGVSHTYVWASGADVLSASNPNVMVRITPSDTAVGTAGTTGVFTVLVDTRVAVMADFNGDGTSDVLWHNQSTGSVVLWLVNKTGGLLGAQTLGVVDPAAWQVAGIGDFNGDGTPDVLWHNQSTGSVVAWLVNKNGVVTGTPNLGSADSTWRLAGVGDFNGDKTSDVLWYNQSTGLVGAWIIKRSTLSSWAGLGTVDPKVWRVAGVGDFNGDKTSDVLWQNQATGLVGAWIVKNAAYNRWAGFGAVDPAVWRVTGVADLNGDRSADVLMQNQSTSVVGAWIMQNAAPGCRWATVSAADPSVWKTAAVGDFNADGTSDVLWQNLATGQVAPGSSRRARTVPGWAFHRKTPRSGTWAGPPMDRCWACRPPASSRPPPTSLPSSRAICRQSSARPSPDGPIPAWTPPPSTNWPTCSSSSPTWWARTWDRPCPRPIASTSTSTRRVTAGSSIPRRLRTRNSRPPTAADRCGPSIRGPSIGSIC